MFLVNSIIFGFAILIYIGGFMYPLISSGNDTWPFTFDTIPILLSNNDVNEIEYGPFSIEVEYIIADVVISGNTYSNINTYLILFLIQLIELSVYCFCSFFASKLFKNLSQEFYFVPINSALLNKIGWILIVSSILFVGISFLPGEFLFGNTSYKGFYIESLEFLNKVNVTAGISCLIFASILKLGNKIYEEQKLTV